MRTKPQELAQVFKAIQSNIAARGKAPKVMPASSRRRPANRAVRRPEGCTVDPADLLLALGIVGCFVMTYLWAVLLYEIFNGD